MKADKIILSIVVTILLALYTVAIFGFLASEGEVRVVDLLLIATPLIALLMIFPRSALVILAVQVFLVRWLYDYDILPREATWLTDIMIILIVGRSLFLMPWRNERPVKIEKYVFALVAFAVLSAILNSVTQTTFVVGIRLAFRYVFLFLAAMRLNVSITWVRRYMAFLVLIALIQVPVVIYQFSVIHWTDLDRMSGTFGRGQTGHVGLFMLAILVYLSARMIELSRIRIRYLLIISLMSIPPVLGEAKVYFLLIPLIIAYMIRTEFYRRPTLTAGLIVFGIIIFVSVDYVVTATGGWKAGNNPLSYVQRIPEAFQDELRVAEYGRFGRADRLIAALHLAAASPKTALIGEGPGSITALTIFPNHSRRASYYSSWGLSSEEAMTFPWLLIEYGYLGTAAFFYLLWLVYRRGKVLRHSSDVELRILGRTLEGITVIFVIGIFYSGVWQMDSISMMFWGLAGIIIHLSLAHETESQTLTSPQSADEELRPAMPLAEEV